MEVDQYTILHFSDDVTMLTAKTLQEREQQSFYFFLNKRETEEQAYGVPELRKRHITLGDISSLADIDT